MQCAIVLTATIIVLLPNFAWADWKYAHWGATPEELARASGGAVKVLEPAKRIKHPDPWNSETAARGTYVDGALRLKLTFSFDSKSGGLNCIVFESLERGSSGRLKEMFVALNGPPKTSVNHKDMGMETFTWSTRKDDIGLTLMNGDSFATQCVPGTNPPVE